MQIVSEPTTFYVNRLYVQPNNTSRASYVLILYPFLAVGLTALFISSLRCICNSDNYRNGDLAGY